MYHPKQVLVEMHRSSSLNFIPSRWQLSYVFHLHVSNRIDPIESIKSQNYFQNKFINYSGILWIFFIYSVAFLGTAFLFAICLFFNYQPTVVFKKCSIIICKKITKKKKKYFVNISNRYECCVPYIFRFVCHAKQACYIFTTPNERKITHK